MADTGKIVTPVATGTILLMSEYLMKRNFADIYEFRGVLTGEYEIDESIYKSEDTRVLFGNFAVAAFQLAQKSSLTGRFDEAVEWAELSLKFDPDLEPGLQFIGLYYMRAGRTQEAIEYYQGKLRENPRNANYWIMLASVHEQSGQLPAALHNLREGSKFVPGERRLFEYGVRIAALLDQRDTAEDFARRWLADHPDDQEFRALLRDMDRLMREAREAAGAVER